MVIPLGPMQMAGPEAVPEVVKDKYSKFWWVIAVLLVTLAVSEIVTHDVFAVLFHSLLAGENPSLTGGVATLASGGRDARVGYQVRREAFWGLGIRASHAEAPAFDGCMFEPACSVCRQRCQWNLFSWVSWGLFARAPLALSEGHVRPERLFPSRHARHHQGSKLDLAGDWALLQEKFEDIVRATPLIDKQKNIYITTVAGRSYKLSAEGQLIWTHYTDGKGSVPGVGSLWESVMLLLTRKGFLIAIDIDTGTERWARKITEQVATATDCALLTQGLIIVSVMDPVPLVPQQEIENSRLMALSIEDGSFRWSFAPYRPTFNFQAATVDDDSFVFQDRTGGVYRLSTDGKLLWYAKTPDRESSTTAAVVLHDGRVFAVSNAGKQPAGLLHVYDYEDGEHLWTQELPHEANQAVAVGELAGSSGKTSLILGMGKNPGLPLIARVALSLPTIVVPLFWPFHLLSLSFPSVFAKKEGRAIFAVDAATGAVRWYHEMDPYHRPAAAGDSENVLARFRATQNGSNPNNEPVCLPDANAQPVIDGAGTAFVPFQDGKIYALRDDNGDGKISPEEVKEHLVGAGFQASPAMAPGLFAVIDCSGRLEVFLGP
ncbi:hypothetical protein AK812_SmicGene29205 [Symbiodinium microadriaticum]|uniref:EF-hand domain-containing protein n=1 Tax=Symbiodinium microadriaticum TaxID=2951 RepID=A0A1Q9D2E4_SYMMI|nr:hypothetical protein AK812_SmicGene29205 [Symbiodinium microadriaticum]